MNKIHFNTLFLFEPRRSSPSDCVCVWYCVGWKKKMANCHAFPLCVWYSSLQLVSCLCAILQAIQLILSLCIFLAIPLQQSELCFYYYCVSVGFALCDIPFFSFFSRVSKRKKANKNKKLSILWFVSSHQRERLQRRSKKKKKAGMIFKAQSPIAVCVCVCVHTFIRVNEWTNKQPQTGNRETIWFWWNCVCIFCKKCIKCVCLMKRKCCFLRVF